MCYWTHLLPRLNRSSLSHFAILSEGQVSLLHNVVIIIQAGIWRQQTDPERAQTLGMVGQALTPSYVT